MIVFHNSGELAPEMFQTFGVNVKESENPIGYFGTGLKYAIAVVLRLGGKIEIRSGIARWRFGVRDVEIRGKSFKQPFYWEDQWIGNSFTGARKEQKLPFTLELGKNWKPWMAYREFWSNCMDEEGGQVNQLTLLPRPGRTEILVDLQDFETIFQDSSQYFLDCVGRDPIYEDRNLVIYPGTSPCLFYRGIRVHDFGDSNSQFTYNFTRDLALTEDRQISSIWEAKYNLIRALEECHDPEILRTIMTSGPGWFEHELNWDYFTGKKVAKEIAKEIRGDTRIRPSQSLVSWMEKAVPVERARPPALILTRVQTATVEITKQLVENLMGMELTSPIVVCAEAPDEWIIDGTIYIPHALLDDAQGLFVHLLLRVLEISHEPKEIPEILGNELFKRLSHG